MPPGDLTALAMSGSSAAYDELRNKFGITSCELTRYGAESSLHPPGIKLRTPREVERAASALTNILVARRAKQC